VPTILLVIHPARAPIKIQAINPIGLTPQANRPPHCC
jgi:hypothetical protein